MVLSKSKSGTKRGAGAGVLNIMDRIGRNSKSKQKIVYSSILGDDDDNLSSGDEKYDSELEILTDSEDEECSILTILTSIAVCVAILLNLALIIKMYNMNSASSKPLDSLSPLDLLEPSEPTIPVSADPASTESSSPDTPKPKEAWKWMLRDGRTQKCENTGIPEEYMSFDECTRQASLANSHYLSWSENHEKCFYSTTCWSPSTKTKWDWVIYERILENDESDKSRRLL